jgi:hypothetical protein
MKYWFILISAVLFTAKAVAQDPLHWNFSSKKIADGKYEIHLTATVEAPWHTYSQSTPDGGPIPTKIVFHKNPLIIPDGSAKEIGELKTVHDEIFGVDVKYFPGNVDFVQVVHLKGKVKTAVSGTVEFMVCNEKQCLPPKTVPFTIQLR